MGLESLYGETASQIAIVVAVVLGLLHIWSLRRFIYKHGGQWKFIFAHEHRWEYVMHTGHKNGGFEADQICKCGANRKIQYWPPTEHEE